MLIYTVITSVLITAWIAGFYVLTYIDNRHNYEYDDILPILAVYTGGGLLYILNYLCILAIWGSLKIIG